MQVLLTSIRTTLVLATFTGLLFPLLITVIAQSFFPYQANGSLISEHGKIVGSKLLAQGFTKPEYFHPRPSAAGSGYAGEASGGTNLGPTSDKLVMGIADDPKTPQSDESFAGVKQLVEQFRKENSLADTVRVPVDAVTRSASGLDPHISVMNATMQAQRVAKNRGVSAQSVEELIKRNIEPKSFGILGVPVVNVLVLNIQLDERKNERQAYGATTQR